LNEIVNLCVLFDDKLLFNEHLNFILPKAYAMFGFVKRNTLLLKDVRSMVEYALFIWNPSGSVQIKRIERLEKNFLKFALQTLHFTEPAPPYGSQCSLLHTYSLRDRRAIAGLLFLNDFLVGNMDCPCLLGCINFNVPARNLRTMVS